jgi:hypothetical protein
MVERLPEASRKVKDRVAAGVFVNAMDYVSLLGEIPGNPPVGCISTHFGHKRAVTSG